MIRDTRILERERPGNAGDEIAQWVSGTLLGREWFRMKDEILRHKWVESERAGQDIGWDRAFVTWMVHHRHGFPKAREGHSLR